MDRHRRQLVAYAAASVALLAAPSASAAADAGAPEADASASVKKKVKKLNKKVKLLQQQLEEVSKQSGPQGQAGPRGPQGPPGPSSGPAGGDLTGSYPNPSIAAGVLSGFLEGTDPIPGGDLSGDYANPEIKSGTVGTPEFGTIPAARAFNSANQTVPSSTFTDLNLNSELFDTANLHSLDSPGNQNLTAPVDGVYEVSAQLQWGFGGTIDGSSVTAIVLASNGQRVNDSEAINPATNTLQNVSGLLRLNAGDTITLRVFTSNSTEAAVFGNAIGTTPSLSMHWIGP